MKEKLENLKEQVSLSAKILFGMTELGLYPH